MWNSGGFKIINIALGRDHNFYAHAINKTTKLTADLCGTNVHSCAKIHNGLKLKCYYNAVLSTSPFWRSHCPLSLRRSRGRLGELKLTGSQMSQWEAARKSLANPRPIGRGNGRDPSPNFTRRHRLKTKPRWNLPVWTGFNRLRVSCLGEERRRSQAQQLHTAPVENYYSYQLNCEPRYYFFRKMYRSDIFAALQWHWLLEYKSLMV